MQLDDRQPLADAPATDRIRRRANNRLGAVYSALYSFWTARHTAAMGREEALFARPGLGAVLSALHSFWSAGKDTVPAGNQTVCARRDAYSVVLFNHLAQNALVNDSKSSPDQLLDTLLAERASGGTDFTSALRAGEAVMVQNWSTERLVT
jgi:hypothetical protein